MIWLIGHKGMLGTDVAEMLGSKGHEYIATDIDLDITDSGNIEKFINGKNINWIINCSAYTAVDRAEDEPERAYKINADGVGNIADAAKVCDAKMIHFSTDYVYGGDEDSANRETDIVQPQGIYGKSKYRGEQHVISNWRKCYIIRISWLFGMNGNNFVKTMLRLFTGKKELQVVDDQWGSPTYTKDVATLVYNIIKTTANNYGIYNYSNEGKTSWYHFANAIYTKARKRGIVDKTVTINPVPTSAYPQKALRPKNSYMSKKLICETFGIEIPSWEDALDRFLDEYRLSLNE